MALKPLSRRKESVADDASEEVEKKQKVAPASQIGFVARENVLVGVQSVVLFFSQLLFFFKRAK